MHPVAPSSSAAMTAVDAPDAYFSMAKLEVFLGVLVIVGAACAESVRGSLPWSSRLTHFMLAVALRLVMRGLTEKNPGHHHTCADDLFGSTRRHRKVLRLAILAPLYNMRRAPRENPRRVQSLCSATSSRRKGVRSLSVRRSQGSVRPARCSR